jgi:phosphate transport system substrate-binding protein
MSKRRREKRSVIRTAAPLGVAIAVSGAVGAWAGPASAAPKAGGVTQLTETGSTLLYPLFQRWAPVYQKLFGVTITPQGTGSGTGISQAEEGTVDIGASDAYLPPTAPSDMENIALAISAQQINYNVPGAGNHLKLSGPVLADIYTGKITKWNAPEIQALNPGRKLPNLPIYPLHRADGSGDTFLFTSYLTDSAKGIWTAGYGTTVSWPAVANAYAATGNGGMVTSCAKIKGCVAYIGVSYEDQAASHGLGEAMIENASGRFLLPNPQTIAAEATSFVPKTPPSETISLIYGKNPNGYPIINYEYAIVKKNQPNAKVAAAIKAFLTWAVSPTGGNQPRFLNAVHFQPLPPSVRALSLAQINKIS